jgi:ring-1,2-phenylacetyl-CoA epoxidase subunit PaaD
MVNSPHETVAAVVDPELRVITIEELGVLRSVATDDSGRVTVTITPTYSGCPAMDAIRADIRAALASAGYPDVDVVTRLAPAWSTDLISQSGREKLAAAGVAPPARLASPAPASVRPPARLASPATLAEPAPVSARPPSRVTPPAGPVPVALSVRCPRCGSPDTRRLSAFGSTACKALWRCEACREPFDEFKPL